MRDSSPDRNDSQGVSIWWNLYCTLHKFQLTFSIKRRVHLIILMICTAHCLLVAVYRLQQSECANS
jgi:hypothetical protein